MNTLFLIWYDQNRNVLNQIGELLFENDNYTFKYTNFARNELQLFTENGLFPGFYDINTIYEGKELFQNIKERLPQKNRLDYHSLLNHYGIDNAEDDFEVLKKTEGKIESDYFMFVTFNKLQELNEIVINQSRNSDINSEL